MRKLTIILVLLLVVITGFAQKPMHHTVVFDVTGSMIGKGSIEGVRNPNIWDRSVDLLGKQLNSFSKGDFISLYTFGVNVTPLVEKQLVSSKNDIDRIFQYIQNFDTTYTEDYTCTWKALHEILIKIDTSTYENNIYLFSDGNPTPIGVGGCGQKNSSSIRNLFYSQTNLNSVLSIYNLNPGRQVNLGDNDRIMELDSVFNTYRIVLQPFNQDIVFFRDRLSSNQRFIITGTGKEYLDSVKSFDVPCIYLQSNTGNIIPFNIESLQPTDNMHSIVFNPFNPIEAYPRGIYTGSLEYKFDGQKYYKQRLNTNISIQVEVVGTSKVKLINQDVPRVDVNLIDVE